MTSENDGLKFQAEKKPQWMKKNEHEKNAWKKTNSLGWILMVPIRI